MTAGDSTDASTEGQRVVVERVIEAPREVVWRAFTEPAHFMRWYGPRGVAMSACEIDLRVGGRHLFGLRLPDGRDYWTSGVYLEIMPPERFVSTDSMADEHGNAVTAAHYGMGGDMPIETTVTVSLEDLGDGRTGLTLSQAGWPDEDMAAGAGGGWDQAFDKLAELLAAAWGAPR